MIILRLIDAAQRRQRLAANHLEVIAADKSEPALGVDQQTCNRLAQSVDLIVDAAAMVNHVLPTISCSGPISSVQPSWSGWR